MKRLRSAKLGGGGRPACGGAPKAAEDRAFFCFTSAAVFSWPDKGAFLLTPELDIVVLLRVGAAGTLAAACTPFVLARSLRSSSSIVDCGTTCPAVLCRRVHPQSVVRKRSQPRGHSHESAYTLPYDHEIITIYILGYTKEIRPRIRRDLVTHFRFTVGSRLVISYATQTYKLQREKCAQD